MEIVRDIIILVIAALMVVKGGFIGAIVGIGIAVLSGGNLARHLRNKKEQEEASPTPSNNNKITITDLSDVKEVNVEKEK